MCGYLILIFDVRAARVDSARGVKIGKGVAYAKYKWRLKIRVLKFQVSS